MQAEKTKKSWRRVDRSFSSPKSIQITDRDVEIIRSVNQHRFLTSDQIVYLFSGSKQLRMRLTQLWRNGLLDRPTIQVERYRAGGGSRPTVYALGNKGADLLNSVDGLRRAQIDWTGKNREVGHVFLEHALRIADFLLKLEVSVREIAGLELITFDDILANAPPETRRKRNPAGWKVSIPVGNTLVETSIYPDAIFGVRNTTATADRQEMFFFLEIDRATMPVMRSDLRQTSFHKKLLAYHHSRKLWRLDRTTAPYKFVNAKVVSVTTSPERIESFIEASKRATDVAGGTGRFLFIDFPSIDAPTNLFELTFQNGKGEDVLLI